MITAQQVKALREKTGAGMMECKRALEDAGGDMERAVDLLRQRGLAQAAKKAGRRAEEGLIASYVHGGGRIGVLVEVNCETDFVAATEDFRTLAHDLAMHIAAARPRWVERADVPEEDLRRERAVLTAQAEAEGKPPAIVERIVEGRLNKFFQETCLLEQPFVKNPDQTVGDLIREHTARLGENIRVRRFVRFERGESA
jgi:elongation factor Ts